jgi:prepilin-type processing-associated H-X9-DG protein
MKWFQNRLRVDGRPVHYQPTPTPRSSDKPPTSRQMHKQIGKIGERGGPRHPPPPRERGFRLTFIESGLVVLVLGLLAAVGVVAVARMSGRHDRARCAFFLSRWALAASQYRDVHGRFPGGTNDGEAVPERHFTWVSGLAPYLGQEAAAGRPSQARFFEGMACPSDRGIPLSGLSRRGYQGSVVYALVSYKGSAGTVAHPRQAETADGMFARNRAGVRLEDVRDGAATTLLFGERLHKDPRYAPLTDKGVQDDYYELPGYAAAFDAECAPCVLSGTNVPLNFRLPHDWNCDRQNWLSYLQLRRSGFGSGHDGGSTFAMADGSVWFARETMSHDVLKVLGTRAGGEEVGGF